MRAFIIVTLLVLCVGAPLYAAQYLLIFNSGNQAAPPPPPPPVGAFNDVFVGPFNNWINACTGATIGNSSATCSGAVNTFCTAADNTGVADSSAAIQSCINNGETSVQGSVLYFPAGTYKIAGTITPAGGASPQLIGHSQFDTTLLWAGPSGGTMFNWTCNPGGPGGVIYERLKFDGNVNAEAGVGVYFTPPQSNCITVIQGSLEDSIFTHFSNAGIVFDSAASDFTMIRDTFTNNSVGYKVVSFDSLQNDAYFSTFTNNTYGISTNGSMPTASYSFFSGNTIDILANPGDMTPPIRGNVSIGSGQFLVENGGGGSLGQSGFSVFDNRIVNSTNANTIIESSNQPLELVGNQITENPSHPPYVTNYLSNSVAGSVLSVGNTFDVPVATAESGVPTGGGATYQSVDDATSSTISTTPPSMPPEPPICSTSCTTTNGAATCAAAVNPAWTCPIVANVTSSASTATIQADINAACSAPNIGHKPVIHLTGGMYSIAATLTVPSGCDVQLVGDAWAIGTSSCLTNGCTMLNWAGASGGWILSIGDGTTGAKAVVKNMAFNGPGAGAIKVTAADVVGSRINTWKATNSFWQISPLEKIVGLAHTAVHMLQGGGVTNTAAQPWVLAVGNGQPCTWSATSAPVGNGCGVIMTVDTNTQTNLPSQGGAPGQYGVRVTNGGNLIETGNWSEQNVPGTQVTELSGDSGNLAVDQLWDLRTGAITTAPIGSYQINNFTGNLYVANSLTVGGTSCGGYSSDSNPMYNIPALPSASNVLLFGDAWQFLSEAPNLPSPIPSGLAFIGPYIKTFCIGSTQQKLSDFAPVTSPNVIRSAMAMLRWNRLVPDTSLPDSVDDVQITHTWVVEKNSLQFLCVQSSSLGC